MYAISAQRNAPDSLSVDFNFEADGYCYPCRISREALKDDYGMDQFTTDPLQVFELAKNSIERCLNKFTANTIAEKPFKMLIATGGKVSCYQMDNPEAEW